MKFLLFGILIFLVNSGSGQIPIPSEPQVKNYIKLPFEDGPLSIEMKEMYPRLEFVGEFNGKAYYYFEEGTDFSDSKSKCEGLGGQMATFDSLDESDFVYDHLPSQYYWTSAVGTNQISNFRWETNGGPIGDYKYSFFGSSRLGLIFSAYTGEFYPKFMLQAVQTDYYFFTLCQVPVEK